VETQKPRRAKLDPDWYPDSTLVARIEKLGLAHAGLTAEIEEFIDYWTQGPRSHTARTQRGWAQALINHLKHQAQRRSKGAQHGKSNGTDVLARNLQATLESQAPSGW
jgi:hypothetical protein